MPWMQKSGGEPAIVPDYMADTVARCLREGWAIVPDPRGQAALSDTVPAGETYIDPDPAHTAAVAQEQAVEQVRAVKVRNASARKWVERKH